MHSSSEENYLKTIYKLQEQSGEIVINSDLARALEVHSASVTDMLKKMARKKLIHYEKSKGVRLTEKGKQVAIVIIRKHRLWELFLVEKLGFKWDVRDVVDSNLLADHHGYGDTHEDLKPCPSYCGKLTKT